MYSINYAQQLLSARNSGKDLFTKASEAVKNKRMKKKHILKGLKSMIRHEDYDEEDVTQLVDRLYEISNPWVEIDRIKKMITAPFKEIK